MTTFIKTKFKESDDQTNIHKSRVAANITEYHIKIKLPRIKVFKGNTTFFRFMFPYLVLGCICLRHVCLIYMSKYRSLKQFRSLFC